MRPRVIAIIIVIVTALAIAVTMTLRICAAPKKSVNIPRAVYPAKGIDISAHNGEIDFNKVAEDSISFVYIKISEGASWRDTRFEQNYDKARQAGLAVGIYHFFRFDVEGWRQSVNIIRAIGNRKIDLPIAIDVEEWGNPTGVDTKHIVQNLRSLIDLLRQAGRQVIIYTNKSGYSRFVRGHFDDVDLWICSFTNPPIVESSRWKFWQHSHIGKINGINGNVDLITFNTPVYGQFTTYLGTQPALPLDSSL